VQNTNKKLAKVGVAAWIYAWPGGSHFVFEFSGTFLLIENETKSRPHPFQ